MSKGHNASAISQHGSLPADAREALQWFVNTYGLYLGSTRGLFVTDWAQEQEATLEGATINLKSRGFHPLTVTGDTLYKQADYLWKESRANTTFGRPLATKLELELGGSDVVIVDNLEAPENSRHLWYLWSHLLYPRAISGKPTIITTPLSFEEFVRYGDACNDPDFCGKAVNWEKLIWIIEASMITVDVLKLAYEQSLPPMLKAEYQLYTALKERGLEVVPQHVLGDLILDFALIDKEKRLDIEVDTVSTIGSSEMQRQEATRNLVLFSDGWQVLKFTTCDILSNKATCVDAVDDVWRSGRKRSGTGRLLTGNMVPSLPELPVDDDVEHGAITYGGGPAAVCGGAGTGKTTCVIQRVAWLLGEGVNPESILVLTHATDTQRSLKRGIEQVVDKQAMQRLGVFSWQDLGLRILKENMQVIKRKPPLKIEPSPQKIVQRLLAKAKKEIDPAKLELSVDLDEFYIAAVISMYKAHLISPKQAKDEAATYGEEIIAKIYQQLEDQLQKANRIDRDDVIALAVQVLLETPELRARYQRQYEFVLIDEYQDVTVAQDMLGRLLAAPQDNLFFVGDEDETVCEAKNACPELFTELSLRIPQARCFTLEKNWRSHPAIVDHARQLIAGLKKHRVDKEYVSAWGQAPTSAIVGPAVLADEFAEANWVAQEIQLLADSGRNYGDMAILFRHHVYANILEEALDQRKIHYQACNPISNFIPDEIEDMMAFLKLVVDPDGPRARESFERVCQLRVKEIDPKLSATIASFGEANNLSYLKAVEIYSEATSDQSCQDLNQLVRVIRTMHQEKLPPPETIALVRRTLRLNEYYRTVKVPAGVNYEPLKKLTQLEEESREFKTVADFVKHIAGQKQSASGVADQGVQVLPILDSKGLEFSVVFMVGMSEGIFPAQNAIDLEEERRICYLGFTRAKELLYLSFPQMFSGAILQPSHFLFEARLLAALPPQLAVPTTPMPAQIPVEQPQIAAAAAPSYAPQEVQQTLPTPTHYLPVPEQTLPAVAQAPFDPSQQFVTGEPAGYPPVEQQQAYYDQTAHQPEAQYQQPVEYNVYGVPVDYQEAAPVPPVAADQFFETAQQPGAWQPPEPVQPEQLAWQQPEQAPEPPSGWQPAQPVQETPGAWQQPEPVQETPGVWQQPETIRETPAAWQQAEPMPEIPVDWQPAEPVPDEPIDWQQPEPMQEAQAAWQSSEPSPAATPEIAHPQPEPATHVEPAISAVDAALAAAFGEAPLPPQATTFGRREVNDTAGGAPDEDWLPADERAQPAYAQAPESFVPPAQLLPHTEEAAPEPPAAEMADEPMSEVLPSIANRLAAAEAQAHASADSAAEPPGETEPPVKSQPATNFAPDVVPVRASEYQLPAELAAALKPLQAPKSDDATTPPQAPAARPHAAAARDLSAASQPAADIAGLSSRKELQPQMQVPGVDTGKPSEIGVASEMSPAPPVELEQATQTPPTDPFRIFTGEPEQPPQGLPNLPKSKGAAIRKARQKQAPQTEPAAKPAIEPAAAAPVPPVRPQLPPMPAGPQHHALPAAARHGMPAAEIPAVPASLEQQLHQVFGRTPEAAQPAVPQPAPLPVAPPAMPTQTPAEHPTPSIGPASPVSRGPLPQQMRPQEPVAPAARSMPLQTPPAAQPAQRGPVPPSMPHEQPERPAAQQQFAPAQPAWEAPARAPIPSQPAYQGGYVPQYPGAMPGQVPAEAGQPLCPACHMPLEANARFCSECGYALPSRIPACPTCSAPLEMSAKFCGECGMDLSAPVAGDSTQISDNMVRMQNLKEKQAGWVNKIWKMLES